MEKKPPSGLFANDGSFMERFKQLQQEKGVAVGKSEQGSVLDTSTPRPVISKTSFDPKANGSRKIASVASSGKLAFSLKQKSKLVAPPIKLSEDDDEEEKDAGNSSDGGLAKRQKLGKPVVVEQSSNPQQTKHIDMAPPPPSDPTVKTVADKLASFVAKNGREFEDITKQKNPGDSPFRFLFDKSCADYKYYEYQLSKEENALSEVSDSQTTRNGTGGSQRSVHQRPNYQTPASALYDYNEDTRASTTSNQATSRGKSGYGESSGPAGSDPIAMMEFYMKKAAQEEKKRQPRHSNDEMPPPASLQGPVKKGHHMGDYIPQEELEQFLATCNDVAAQKAAKEAAERAKIKSDNVGHKLLSKMGWKEGEGLGSSKSGIADPITAGNVKLNNLGVGAHQPGEVTPDDDIYEQYKKRMMLGYKYRPNPLNNPRKQYY